MSENRENSKKVRDNKNFKQDKSTLGKDLLEKTVKIRRVVKAIKGGRRFCLSALVVVGDGEGRAGFGLGKGKEVADAIKKAKKNAQKKMQSFVMDGHTIPYEVCGRFGSARVILKPAPEGTGLRAGASVRTVAELIGVKDLYSKCLGSSNPINITAAVFEGFSRLKNKEEMIKRRKLDS